MSSQPSAPPAILSIQSHVVYGHVGNAAAVFPLQRLGFEVWPLHTVQFSNHTGYGAWRGQVFEAEVVEALVSGLEERGALGGCAAVLSGYMGSAAIGDAILAAVQRTRRARPDALYCCDPVMGDVGRGVFVRAELPAFFAEHAVPIADILTPNHFELELLTARQAKTAQDLATCLDRLHALGPRVILVTSVQIDSTPPDSIELVVSTPGERHRLRTPRLPLAVNGTGDAVAALFLGRLLKGEAPVQAMEGAGASIYGLLRHTAAAGTREIQLVAAQDEFVNPSQRFPSEPL